MRLRNRDGSPVDPVPFAVTAGLGFMVLLSFGPLYGQALGASLSSAIAASTAAFLALAVGTFYRYVWTMRPELNGHVSATARAEGLFYLMIALPVIVVGLAIPLVAGA